MSTFTELLKLLANGILLLAKDRTAITITILIATALAGLSWYLCNNYVKLWNRRFRLTTTHQVLTIVASLLTFCFVLAFGGLKYMDKVTGAIIAVWEGYEIKADTQWGNATFKDAYNKVKATNTEDFTEYISPERGGNRIPATKQIAQETAANVYASAACNHFSQAHTFLSKIIWSTPEQATKNISVDVVNYFRQNTGSTYTTDKAIDIAASTIKTQLAKQLPRTVTLSRIGLVVLYLLVMAIPLSLIGFAAYKDIRIQK